MNSMQGLLAFILKQPW